MCVCVCVCVSSAYLATLSLVHSHPPTLFISSTSATQTRSPIPSHIMQAAAKATRQSAVMRSQEREQRRIASLHTWSKPASTGEHRGSRAQESPGDHRTSQESLDREHMRAQGSPGEHRRAQSNPR